MSINEQQEEALDDRSARVKLEDACRLVLETKARRDALAAPNPVSWSVFMEAKEAKRLAERAFADLVRLINEQFGDEVDVELLAKALAS